MRKAIFHFFLILFICESGISQNQTEQLPIDTFLKSSKYRCIGPFRGGRSVTASGVVNDPLVYYMGTTGGGLWKTEDAGQRWTNISDGFFTTGSVGAVSVSESDPNIVYCGMGEHAPRGVMTHHGDGVLKSVDAGKTWSKIGLEGTQHISRVVIHPTNPDIVYVAAQGALYGRTKERGIYKTEDGGKTWRNILYVNDRTGCSELSMDMNFPNILYATMWEHQRLPWKVISGGEGSGVYKSVDGGESWFKIEKGLPDELGKMAISVCRSNSNKVYALIESDSDQEKGGLFVSNNAGATWSRISKDHRLVQRAWYYIEVFADPNDDHTVYVLSAPALRSIDGGKTWEVLSGTHGDYHDLWINPNNSRNMVIANDGGAAISFNYAKTWSTQSNMPTAQFYRVNVDNQFPYRIYGGQQDNSSVSIAHREFDSRYITTRSWHASAGGESAFLAFDPDHPRYVLGGSYLGTIEALDNDSKAGTKIMAAPIQYLGRDASDMKYRYNWNAPIIWSQHEPNTYYHAAQVLLKTSDLGRTWKEVSPDLTRNEKEKQGKGGGPYTNEAVGAENYGTISYVAESEHRQGEIWVGSDDGLVHVTRDGGTNWENVTPDDLQECLINAIDISPHDPSTIYIATTRYKFNDHTPALYKTTNGGKSWTNITKGIPQGAFTRVVREDHVKKNLLFAGTETGVYISFDGGANWESFQLNLPLAPITDLIIKHDDLVVATSGRSFWVYDDVELLRQLEVENTELKLYDPPNLTISNGGSQLNGSGKNVSGTHPFYGVNPSNGVVFYYQLPEVKDESLTLIIKDSNGQPIRTISSEKDPSAKKWDGGPPLPLRLSKHKGLNRFVWDLRHETSQGIPNVYIEGNYRGHRSIPGNYSATLKYGDQEESVTFSIESNPTYSVTKEEYASYNQFMTEVESNLDDMHGYVNTLNKIESAIHQVIKNHKSEMTDQLLMSAKKVEQQISLWDEDMVQRKSKAYDDVENFPNKFTANYLFMINQSESDLPRINQPSLDRRAELDEQWKVLKSRADDLLENVIPELNRQFWKMGIGALD